AWGMRPTVWQVSEGRGAFLILERIGHLRSSGRDSAAALKAVGASTVFTTHTTVPAGHDQFPPKTIAPYLESYCDGLGIDVEKVAALARPPAGADFNMTTLAIPGSALPNRGIGQHWGRTPP